MIITLGISTLDFDGIHFSMPVWWHCKTNQKRQERNVFVVNILHDRCFTLPMTTQRDLWIDPCLYSQF